MDIYDKMIEQIEEEHKKRMLAEKALRWCSELCDSHFEHSRSRNNDTDSRFTAIRKVVTEYFNKTINIKENNDENRGIQSEHC